MTAFYGSPEGQSASRKFGPYMMGVMPQIQQEVKKGHGGKAKASRTQRRTGSGCATSCPTGCQVGCTAG